MSPHKAVSFRGGGTATCGDWDILRMKAPQELVGDRSLWLGTPTVDNKGSIPPIWGILLSTTSWEGFASWIFFNNNCKRKKKINFFFENFQFEKKTVIMSLVCVESNVFLGGGGGGSHKMPNF